MSLPFYLTWTAQDTAATLPVQSAMGSRFVLESGEKVVDMTSTSFQSAFGHSEPRILKALEEQLRVMPISSPKAVFDLKTKNTQRLIQLLGFRSGKILYTVSGAESVENALKIARQISGRKLIAARTKSYHGASLGALSVTGDWRNAEHVTVSEWTLRIPEPQDDPEGKKTREIIEDAGPQNVAAFILETITGTNGVIIPPESWWMGIQKICRDHKILFIADEVLTGFGRTGKAFAFHHWNLQPDMVCMSKAITGGYIPFGALWTNQEISDYYSQKIFSCGLTNTGHPLGLAAMGAVLDICEDSRFWLHLKALEKLFSECLSGLRRISRVREVRQKGLLAAIDFKVKLPTKLWSAFIEQGLYVFIKDSQVILAPPLNMDLVELKESMRRFEEFLVKIFLETEKREFDVQKSI